MIDYNRFKDKINSSNLKEFSFRGFEVSIDEALSVKVNNDLILENAVSYVDAVEYAKSYIGNLQYIGENTIVIKDKLAQLIEKHHNTKVTNTLLEAYEELISSNLFTLDPVILEMKSHVASITNKLQFTLSDGSIVAIDESTKDELNSLNVDKYKLVEHMNESKDNFMEIIRTLKG
jgi:flagellar basal body rod protein FlgF